MFGWDYNTWCKCYYYREFGHIGMNCVKHHMRKSDTTRRCFICTELGHLDKNCMNTGRIEDEKKEKIDNIGKKMRQQWISKSTRMLAQAMTVKSLMNWLTPPFPTRF